MSVLKEVCATPSGSKPRRCAQEEMQSTGTRSYPSDRGLPLPLKHVSLSLLSGKCFRQILVTSALFRGCGDRETCSWGWSSQGCCAWLARGMRTRSYSVEHVPCRQSILSRSVSLWRSSRGIGLATVLALPLVTADLSAADLGTYGPLFDIEEPSLLDTIHARLSEMQANGELEQMKSEQQQRTKDYVRRPKPVSGLIRATQEVTWDVDLSITVKEDIADHRGVVFARAGTVVNPLAFSRFNKRIVLFDGDDQEQLDYALSQGDELDTLLVLVNGDPLSLMRQHGRRFYFDQQSVLTDRFGVRHVPAEITRGSHVMHVREIALGEQP